MPIDSHMLSNAPALKAGALSVTSLTGKPNLIKMFSYKKIHDDLMSCVPGGYFLYPLGEIVCGY